MVILSVLEADLYLASFPSLAHYFATSESAILSSLNIYLFVFSLAVLGMGPLADRWGRKRVFLTSLAIDGMGTLLCLWAPTEVFFWIGRGLQAVGGCAGSVISRVIAKESFPEGKNTQILAYLMVGISLALALTPIWGGLLEELAGWRASFWFLALFQVLLALCVARYVPETLTRPSAPFQWRRLRAQFAHILRQKYFRLFGSLVALVWAGLYLFIGTSSFTLIEIFHQTPAMFGLLFTLFMGGMILGSFVAGFLSKWNLSRSLAFSIAILLAGGVLLLCPPSFLLYSVGVFLYLLGTGIIVPLCQGEMAREGGQFTSSVFSLLIFAQMMGASLVGFLFSYLAPLESVPTFIAMISFAALPLYALIRREYNDKRKTDPSLP